MEMSPEMFLDPCQHSDSLPIVLEHFCRFERHEPTFHHFVEHWKKGADLLFAIDDLDDHWQILAQLKYLAMVELVGLPETDRAAKYGCT